MWRGDRNLAELKIRLMVNQIAPPLPEVAVIPGGSVSSTVVAISETLWVVGSKIPISLAAGCVNQRLLSDPKVSCVGSPFAPLDSRVFGDNRGAGGAASSGSRLSRLGRRLRLSAVSMYPVDQRRPHPVQLRRGCLKIQLLRQSMLASADAKMRVSLAGDSKNNLHLLLGQKKRHSWIASELKRNPMGSGVHTGNQRRRARCQTAITLYRYC